MPLRKTGSSVRSDPHVLIVDDDAEHVGEMAEYLSARGLSIATALSVTDALAELKSSTPRMVIMDVNMPQADGMEGARLLRRAAYDRPIILMSGDAQSVYEANTAQLQIFAVISKPVPMGALERHIRAVLRTDGL